jgi:hypothetical protein
MSTAPNILPPPGFRARRAFAAAAPKSADHLVYLAVVLGYILLLPTQMNLSIAGSVLPPYRFLLIPVIVLIINHILTSRMVMVTSDWLILAATTWICVAMFVNTGGTDAFTAAVANTVDIAVAYFFARIAFKTPRDFRLFLILMAPGLVFIALVIAIESTTHTPFTYEIFNSIFGGRQRRQFVVRLGLMRAFGPFPHPILAGIFLASFLPLYILGGIRGWPRLLGVLAAIGSFFTVSSAALLALVMSLLLLAYNWLTEKVANFGWRLFLAMACVTAFALEVFSQNGAFAVLTRYASLNTVTARHRILIWNHGTKNVAENPWFGIGYNDWERPVWMLESIDHYWLLLAIQFGVIVPFIVAAAIFLAVLNASRASAIGPSHDGRLLRGLAISLAIFAFGVISVSIWQSVQVWFYMLAGAAVSLSNRTFALRRAAMAKALITANQQRRKAA